MWQRIKNFVKAVNSFLDTVVMFVAPVFFLAALPFIWFNELGHDDIGMKILATMGCVLGFKEILLMWKKKLKNDDPLA